MTPGDCWLTAAAAVVYAIGITLMYRHAKRVERVTGVRRRLGLR